MADRGKGTYIYGRHPVSEILRGRPIDVRRLYVASAGRTTRLTDLVRMAEHNGIAITEVSKRTLDDLVGDVPHQGVVAQVAAFAYVDISDLLDAARSADEPPLIVVLDQVQDPHNLGSILRSANALGAHGLVMPKDRACEVTPTVVKASAGATAHFPIAKATNLSRALDELKQAGLWVVGTVAEGGQPIEQIDLHVPTALVIGSEGHGMRRLTTASCDTLAHIPIPGNVGSLNASVAAGICLYEAARQRRGDPL